MIVNVEQSSLGGVVVNVGRLVGIEQIIGSKVFSESRFNNIFYFSVKASDKKTITCGQGLQGSKSTHNGPCKILKYKANDTKLRQSINRQLNSKTIIHT